MSRVTNIIIACPCGQDEHEAFKKLLKEYTDSLETMEFLNFDYLRVGGNKNMEAEIYMASFNYLNGEEFVRFIKSTQEKMKEMGAWDYHFEQMQIFVKGEDCDIWNVYLASELKDEDIK